MSLSTSAVAATTEDDRRRRRWPDYRTVWRWHFYAGLFCIPFVIALSITGSIYLFKPQIEALVDRPYDHLPIAGPPATPAQEIEAGVAAIPGSSFSGYELPPSPDSAGRVLVRDQGQIVRVYVHPGTLAILRTIPENSRLMKIIFRLHGELLLGNTGSFIVELAASWAIVMIASGLYLWWPRGASGLGGILYPRFTRGSRIFWRDVHGVTGVWISALALFMLFTGLPWAKFWGDYFKAVRHFAGTTVLHQDWTSGSTMVADMNDGDFSEHADHMAMPGHHHHALMDFTPINRVVAAVEPLHLAAPVMIAPAADNPGHWTAKSLADDRPLRADVVVDGASGAIVSRTDFRQKPLADRMIGTGIAAHEGQLFGWPNQLLGLLTAAGLITLCMSAVVLWWKRREPGVLGAPKSIPGPRAAWIFRIVLVLFAVYLPMFAISAGVVWLIEKLLLRRMPRVREWLGLDARTASRATISQESAR